MRFNVFRNPYIDAQAGMLVDNFEQAVRNQSEEYWRNEIAKEISNYCQCNHCRKLTLLVRRENRRKTND
jgi:hypothetical protein